MSVQDGLTVQVTKLAVYALVTAVGSIDFGSHRTMSDRLHDALDMTRVAVIVDLSGVDFCDSSGLNSLARGASQARARGLTLVAVGLQGRVERLFAVTHLDRALFAHPTLEDAVRWLEDGSQNPGVS
ncbi:STAS domain-containing protein [Actinomadura barringtoniae]|uniref:Anti-sigma factor antagonist n=1 Tax=Actinomadura barringtoniae TaxID=1427535 RepID=A0A939PP52_9ACTN|nr:STAS domain-containing protein [Actinomadura barringtoniae]MBO2452146.1 STAS domain-containing protein [Actinomadura barringtoniae]